MIEAVHFNNEKPENQNISYPNKKKIRLKYLQRIKFIGTKK